MNTQVVDRNFFIEVEKGNVPGHSIVNKFGRNDAIGTALTVVALGGNYRTPTTVTALEVVSDDATDNIAGVGARKVTVIGLDANFVEQTEEVSMNGLTAVALTNTYLRVYRAYVSESGTYATQSGGSHAGVITIQETGGGDEWARINMEGSFGIGQTQIGAYTIPAGCTGYLLGKQITIDSVRAVSMHFYKRENADDVTSGYTGTMRLFEENDGLTGSFSTNSQAPIQVFPEKTDVGFLGKVATSTGTASVDFQILLVNN